MRILTKFLCPAVPAALLACLLTAAAPLAQGSEVQGREVQGREVQGREVQGREVQGRDEAAIQRGREVFQQTCAACHGPDGEGDGPLGRLLLVAPSNLQTISLDNGGNFPFLRVIATIDGRADVAAHGLREMPVWGEVFTQNDGLLEARGKLLDLTLYIESLQVF